MQLERPTVFPPILLVATLAFWIVIFAVFGGDIADFLFGTGCGGG
jgi:hypothetical protein